MKKWNVKSWVFLCVCVYGNRASEKIYDNYNTTIDIVHFEWTSETHCQKEREREREEQRYTHTRTPHCCCCWCNQVNELQRTTSILFICISHTVSFPKIINSKVKFLLALKFLPPGMVFIFFSVFLTMYSCLPKFFLNYFKWPFFSSFQNKTKMLIVMNLFIFFLCNIFDVSNFHAVRISNEMNNKEKLIKFPWQKHKKRITKAVLFEFLLISRHIHVFAWMIE